MQMKEWKGRSMGSMGSSERVALELGPCMSPGYPGQLGEDL